MYVRSPVPPDLPPQTRSTSTATPSSPVKPPARLPRQEPGAPAVRPPFINLCGDYRFLRGGYWALVDAELNGVSSRPTPLQAITAQNAAACLLVAKAAGIPTVDWKLARRASDVEPPCLLVPVAGLTDTCYQVNKPRSAESQWRSATQNGTRPVLAVSLPGPLRSFKLVLGTTAHEEFQLAWQVWQTFGIPLALVWFVEAPAPTEDDPDATKPLFLGFDPLPLHELSERDLRLFEEVSQRPMSP